LKTTTWNVSQKEIDRANYNNDLKEKKKKLLLASITFAATILICALVFGISSVYCNKDDDYETVEVKLESIDRSFDLSTKNLLTISTSRVLKRDARSVTEWR
jgi:flagellar basal body-associated protein FliL